MYAITNRNITVTAPAYTSTCAAATNSAESSRYSTASEPRFPISASAEKNGLRKETTAIPEPRHAKAAATQTTQTSTLATDATITSAPCSSGSACRRGQPK